MLPFLCCVLCPDCPPARQSTVCLHVCLPVMRNISFKCCKPFDKTKRNQSRALNRALSEFSVSEAQIMSFGACEALLNTDSKRMPIFPTLFPFACFRLFWSGRQSSYKCRTTWMNLMGVIVFKWLLSSFVGLVSSACIQELLLVSPLYPLSLAINL